MTQSTPRFTVLRRDGVGLILRYLPTGLPSVLHWGADLGDLSETDLEGLVAASGRQTAPGTLDAAWQQTILPHEGDGWAGRPGLLATREGRPVFTRWTVENTDHSTNAVVVHSVDDARALQLRSSFALEAGGVVTVEHELINRSDGALEVHWLEATLPLPKTADHLTTFTGRWTREKAPTTTVMPAGAVNRQTRRGRGGHDAPHLEIASIDVPRNRRALGSAPWMER